MFHLAERIGCTVAELAQRITMAELRDWAAYDRIKAHPDAPQDDTPSLETARAAFAPRRA